MTNLKNLGQIFQDGQTVTFSFRLLVVFAAASVVVV